MTSIALGLLIAVTVCGLVLYGCFVAFDRLQTWAEETRGAQRWLAIMLAGGVGLIVLVTFWACFALSAGLMQALGLNLR